MTIPDVPTEEVVDLSPFKHMVMTIGALPTAFTESLTYYEALAYFANYLEQTVIPAVNQNAEATKELQELFTELHDYVEHYFDNLNVQEEINNKLDDMAEHGDLASIIAQFLAMSPVFAYNTISEMASAQNLSNGSIARILGKTNPLTGNGSFYKIRTRTGGDDPDGDNLVAVGETLVAVKIPDYGLNALQSEVDDLEETVDQLNAKEVILIGDSYLAGQSLANPATENFGYLLMNKLGMNTSNFHQYGEGGSSFVAAGNGGHTWQTLLQSKVSEISDVTKVTDIWFFGGYNDVTAENPGQIETAMANCINYAKTTFPNAEIRIALLGNNASTLSAQIANRNLLKNRIYNVYMNCDKYGAICLPKTQLPLQDYTLFENNETAVHPNANGHIAIANWLYQLLKSGDCTFYKSHNAFNLTVDASIGTSTLAMAEDIKNEEVLAALYGDITPTTPLTSHYGDIDLGTQSDIHFLRYVNANPAKNFSTQCTVRGITNISMGTDTPVITSLRINPSGHLVIRYYVSDTSTSIKKLSFEWNWYKFNTQGC